MATAALRRHCNPLNVKVAANRRIGVLRLSSMTTESRVAAVPKIAAATVLTMMTLVWL